MSSENNIKWEKPICDNCKSKKISMFLKNVSYWEFPSYLFNIVKCKNCNLIFLSPRPQERSIHKFYDSKSYWGRDLLSKNKLAEDFKKTRDREFSPVYDIIFKNIKKGKILDIGAGTGIFLTRLKEMGWKIDGIEKSNDAVNFARKRYGIKLRTGDFIDRYPTFKNDYDFITLNMALEHLYHPLETLKSCSGIMKRGGKLIVVVPNIESLGFRIFGKRWYPLQPPIHLHHFSSSTLREMLEKSGFNIIKINHSYPTHSYFSLYESFRFLFSKKSTDKSINNNHGDDKTNEKKIMKESGKIFGTVFANFFSFLGSLLKIGETITVYAEKK